MALAQSPSTPKQTKKQKKLEEKRKVQARDAFDSLCLDSISITSSPSPEKTKIDTIDSSYSSPASPENAKKPELPNKMNTSTSSMTNTTADEDDVYSLDPPTVNNNSFKRNNIPKPTRFKPSSRRNVLSSSSSIVSFSSTRSIMSTSALLGKLHTQVKKKSRKVYYTMKDKKNKIQFSSSRSFVSTRSHKVLEEKNVDDESLSMTEWSQVTPSPDTLTKKVSFSMPPQSNKSSFKNKSKKLYKKLQKNVSGRISFYDDRDDYEDDLGSYGNSTRDEYSSPTNSPIMRKKVVRSVSVLASGTIPTQELDDSTVCYKELKTILINYEHMIFYVSLYFAILTLSIMFGNNTCATNVATLNYNQHQVDEIIAKAILHGKSNKKHMPKFIDVLRERKQLQLQGTRSEEIMRKEKNEKGPVKSFQHKIEDNIEYDSIEEFIHLLFYNSVTSENDVIKDTELEEIKYKDVQSLSDAQAKERSLVVSRNSRNDHSPEIMTSYKLSSHNNSVKVHAKFGKVMNGIMHHVVRVSMHNCKHVDDDLFQFITSVL